MRNVIRGVPGERWTNDTDKIVFQYHCNFINSCGLCMQFDGLIGPYWPLQMHLGCNCKQYPIRAGAEASPFTDFREKLDALPHKQQVAAIGASNYQLLSKGVVGWEDIVTKVRVRDFRDVISAKGLSVKDLVSSGVKPRVAREAYEAVHTGKHQELDRERATLAAALKRHGLTDERIASEVGAKLVSRIVLRRPPGTVVTVPKPPAPTGPGSSPVTPPTTPPATPIPAPAPKPPAPKPKAPKRVPQPVAPPTAPAPAPQPATPTPAPIPVTAPTVGVTPRSAAWGRALEISKKAGITTVVDPVRIKIAFGTDQAPNINAAFFSSDGTIVLNDNSYWADTPRNQLIRFQSRWSSSPNPDHTVTHEIGHALHLAELGIHAWAALYRAKMTAEQATLARTSVSQYSATDPLEFVAEVYAASSFGRKYGDDVMALYREFGGPPIPIPEQPASAPKEPTP